MLIQTIPRFGLTKVLQCDSGPPFISKVTLPAAQVLRITYYVHSAWRPQSSRKVGHANQTLKKTLAKLCQETSEYWVRILSPHPVKGKNCP
jgi:hypothetical protein